MADPIFPLLDVAEEDALHLNRLLSVDERPFQRITKRLLAKDALIQQFPTQLPTPPPDQTQEGEERAVAEPRRRNVEAELNRYRDDMLLEFAALESTLIRIQFLKRANERERERYAAEKSKILATADAVRANTAELRTQLIEAQRTLALKKEYDEEAEKIFKDKSLKPRDVLEAENDKLRAEIEELEQESKEFDGLWLERAERFDRVVAEGRSLMRYMKGEKDEDDQEVDEEGQNGEEGEAKDDSSTVGTPRPDAGGATPLHANAEGEEGIQAAQHELTQRALRSTLRVPGTHSRSSSPAPSVKTETDGKNTEMQMEPGQPEDVANVGGNEASEQMDLA